MSEKIQWLRPGLNPWTRVPAASMLTTRPPKPSTIWCNLQVYQLGGNKLFLQQMPYHIPQAEMKISSTNIVLKACTTAAVWAHIKLFCNCIWQAFKCTVSVRKHCTFASTWWACWTAHYAGSVELKTKPRLTFCVSARPWPHLDADTWGPFFWNQKKSLSLRAIWSFSKAAGLPWYDMGHKGPVKIRPRCIGVERLWTQSKSIYLLHLCSTHPA
jgi:hypothetical protein